MNLCQCGCEGEIIPKPYHKYKGTPKYIQNHYLKSEKAKIAAFKRMQGKPAHNKGVACSEEQKEKISKANKGNTAWNNGLKNCYAEEVNERKSEKLKGRKTSKETRSKISEKVKAAAAKIYTEERNKKISETAKGRKTPEATKRKQSIARSNFLQKNGTSSSGGMFKHVKKGKFYSKKSREELYYESSYELRAFELLEADNAVVSYARCPYRIDYEIEGKIRRYIPDILVTYKSGAQVVIEVKPEDFLNWPINQAKFAAGEKYFNNTEVTFSIWTEHQLNL